MCRSSFLLFQIRETRHLIFISTALILGTFAQYNTSPSYDRDRDRDRDRNDSQYGQNSQYDRYNSPQDRDRQYNRNSPYDRDRQNSPYGQPYNPRNNEYGAFDGVNQQDRNQPYNDHNQTNYGRQNQTYPGQGPPYDSRDPYNRDRNNNRDRYYVENRDQFGNNRDGNRDQYGNQDQYGNRNNQYGNNRDQYGNRDRDQYGNNRDQFGNNRDQYGNNRDQYGNNRDQYGNNRDQYGNRDQFGNRGQFGGDRDRDPYNRNRDQYDNEQQYGSPLSDNGDCCQEYCYATDEQPYLNFATKTPYQIVFGKASNQHRIPDCTPVQFWSINRHGTRFPSARSIDRLRQLHKIHAEIIRNYEQKRSFPDRGKLCDQDLENLKRWRWNETVNERNANSLTTQGIMDLKFLARRYVSKFEELMREPYSENMYSFQYTDTDRTHDSYQAFIEGLFKDKAYQVHANVYNADRVMKPTSRCNTWTREVDENPQTLYEYQKFKHRQEYQQMVRDVFRRLGFRYTLNDTVLNDIYDLCRYEKAWNLEQPSPWCAVFNKEQLKLLEYAEDLKYFYKGGYGREINKQVGCPPVKDLYEKFERTVNNGGTVSSNKVTVFFTNSVNIQTFLTAMGIAKDYSPLTADNYYQQTRRQWRTSTIDPFASNVAAVLYQCRSAERFRVMFFLNEVPVNYPDCSVGLCNWSTVQNKLRTVAENCNLDFCERGTAPGLHHVYVIHVITLVLIFLNFRL